MRSKVVVLIILAAVAVAGATYGWMRLNATADDEAIDLVPRNAIGYASVFLNPSTNQKRALEALLAKFEAAPTPDEAKDRVVALIDEALAEVDLTFENDVEPWLGHQVAGFLLDTYQPEPDMPDLAFLVATDDEAATRAMIDKLDADAESEREKSYEGVDYTLYDGEFASGFVSGFWVFGTEPAFTAAVDAAAGESLADSPEYEDKVSRLAADHVALAYVHGSGLLDLVQRAGASGEMTSEDLAALEAMIETGRTNGATAVSLSSGGVTFESVSDVGAEVASEAAWMEALFSLYEGSGLLRALPEGSWFAFGAPDLGGIAGALLDALPVFDETATPESIEDMFEAETGLGLRDDLLSWMGDFGVFVEGTGLLNLGGGLVIESTDLDKSRAALVALVALARSEGAPIEATEIAGVSGYEVRAPGMPDSVYLLAAEVVVLAYGRGPAERAITGEPSLDDSGSFTRAQRSLGEGFEASLFLDFPPLVGLIESFGAGSDPTYRDDVKPWLEPLSHVITGSRLDGDQLVQKIVIGVR
jgi:hypothetical protein